MLTFVAVIVEKTTRIISEAGVIVAETTRIISEAWISFKGFELN